MISQDFQNVIFRSSVIFGLSLKISTPNRNFFSLRHPTISWGTKCISQLECGVSRKSSKSFSLKKVERKKQFSGKCPQFSWLPRFINTSFSALDYPKKPQFCPEESRFLVSLVHLPSLENGNYKNLNNNLCRETDRPFLLCIEIKPFAKMNSRTIIVLLWAKN